MSIQIEKIYDGIRRQKRNELEQRRSYIYSRVPELGEIPGRRRDAVLAAAAKNIPPDEAARKLEELDRLEERLLVENGFSRNMLELQYSCERCMDTGWIGSAERKPCACRLLLTAREDPSVGINDRETFENYSESIFPMEEQRKQTGIAKAWCERYANSLPRPDKLNVLITGMAGLGKSYLCNAVAYRALSRGIDARVVTAYSFIRTVMDGIKNRTGGIPEIYMRIPLLVIDDLGSESLIPNVSEEAFFSVLNERLHTEKPTIVATNLSVSGLQERYGERVMSRLTDRSSTQAILLTGGNLRWSQTSC